MVNFNMIFLNLIILMLLFDYFQVCYNSLCILECVKVLKNSEISFFFRFFQNFSQSKNALRVLQMCESGEKSIFHHFHTFQNAKAVLELQTAMTGSIFASSFLLVQNDWLEIRIAKMRLELKNQKRKIFFSSATFMISFFLYLCWGDAGLKHFVEFLLLLLVLVCSKIHFFLQIIIFFCSKSQFCQPMTEKKNVVQKLRFCCWISKA